MLGWLFGKKQGGAGKAGGEGAIVAQAAQFLVQSLHVQMAYFDEAEKALPPAAKDAFSLGYVTGYCEAVATMRKIDSDETGFVVHQAVFADIFGPNEGPLLFAQFMKLQEEGNPEVSMGMSVGGEDLMAWLNGETEEPRKWAEYVNKN